MAADSTSLSHEKYISLTTRKKNGDVVLTPVWIAALADGTLAFTTELGSGKVKRIRNFPEVTVQPCNTRGVVTPGSVPMTAKATVLTGSDVDPVEAAIKAKYGMQVPLINALYAIRRTVTRGASQPRAAVRLELD